MSSSAANPPPASWQPVELEHALHTLDGYPFAGGKLRVLLGPTSRFGARYFAIFLEGGDGRRYDRPLVSGLHHQGPLVTYNWIEVAETNDPHPSANTGEAASADLRRLLELLLSVLPPGGHIMVEYDSPARAETARALAAGVPPIATPLGEMLFRLGCGARFKDWQIAEGGSEGPRKLQAYVPPSEQVAERWRREAAAQLEAFLQSPASASTILSAACARAERVLPLLRS